MISTKKNAIFSTQSQSMLKRTALAPKVILWRHKHKTAFFPNDFLPRNDGWWLEADFWHHWKTLLEKTYSMGDFCQPSQELRVCQRQLKTKLWPEYFATAMGFPLLSNGSYRNGIYIGTPLPSVQLFKLHFLLPL